MRSLAQVLTDNGLNLTRWTLEWDGISTDGDTILGIGTDPSGLREGWIATLAEPGIGLLGDCLVCSGLWSHDALSAGACSSRSSHFGISG